MTSKCKQFGGKLYFALFWPVPVVAVLNIVLTQTPGVFPQLRYNVYIHPH